MLRFLKFLIIVPHKSFPRRYTGLRVRNPVLNRFFGNRKRFNIPLLDLFFCHTAATRPYANKTPRRASSVFFNIIQRFSLANGNYNNVFPVNVLRFRAELKSIYEKRSENFVISIAKKPDKIRLFCSGIFFVHLRWLSNTK